jgi:hypothetical protein
MIAMRRTSEIYENDSFNINNCNNNPNNNNINSALQFMNEVSSLEGSENHFSGLHFPHHYHISHQYPYQSGKCQVVKFN